MGPIKSSTAVLLTMSVLVVLFYLSLHQELSHSVRSRPQDLSKQNFSTPSPSVQTVTFADSQDLINVDFKDILISQDFRKFIPQSGAYWNWLLLSALRDLDNKEETLKNKTSWRSCRQENENHLQVNMHDYYSYPDLLKTFLRSINCMSPPVLINQPNKCIPGEKNRDKKTFLLFAIKSTPRNFERRQVVRETWGLEGVHQNGLSVRLIFLLGNTSPDDPDLSALLSYEAEHFQDLLQWDFHDSFFNLTLKMSTFLKWTMKNCPQVSFVFSGDDDVFVNTPLLLTYLQSLDDSKASQLYVGHVIDTASPIRDPRNKYYIPLSFYNGPYPAYAGGGGFVFSGALLQPLYLASRVVPFYPIDDVYFGMLSKALGVSAEPHTGFQTFDIRAQDRANVCAHKNLILIHQRFPQEMKKMWNAIHSPLLTC